jgi:hypothetical protein
LPRATASQFSLSTPNRTYDLMIARVVEALVAPVNGRECYAQPRMTCGSPMIRRAFTGLPC